MSPIGAIFVPFPPKTGKIVTSPPSPIVELVLCSRIDGRVFEHIDYTMTKDE